MGQRASVGQLAIAIAIGVALAGFRLGEARANASVAAPARAPAAALGLASADTLALAPESAPAGAADGAARLHVPALSPGTGSGGACAAELAIMSLGPAPSQAIIARFAPAADGGCSACAGPTSLACTGLLRPGGAWRLVLEPGDGAFEVLGSAVIFSVSAAPLERIAPGGGPAPAASVLCAALNAAIAAAPDPSARCAVWSDFEAAWAAGVTYGGVPLDRAVGAPIGGSVVAACPDGIAALPVVAAAVGAAAGSAVAQRLPALHPDETIVVQNAGSECVSVELAARANGACTAPVRCMAFDVAPGQARSITVRACTVPGAGAGAVREITIGAGGPVSVALVRRDGQGTDLSGAPADAAEMLAAPLVFDPEQGWTSTVDVTAHPEPPAELAVTIDFLDAAGRRAARVERRICASGSISVSRAATSALPGLDAGGVRVSARRADGTAGTARVAARVRLVRPADSGPGEEPGAGGASASYSLVPLDPAGAGVLALPALNKRASADEGSSAIGLASAAAAGVSTEYAMLLFDPSGLVDTSCGTLEAGAVEYIDLDRWATIPAGFRGSAIISATRWRHAGIGSASGSGSGAEAGWGRGLRSATGASSGWGWGWGSGSGPSSGWEPVSVSGLGIGLGTGIAEQDAAAPVSLSAVAARWSGPAGEGDRLAIAPAIALPFGSEAAAALAGALPPAPCEPGVPIPGTTATSTPRASPSPTATPRPTSSPTSPTPPAGPHEVWLPLAQRAHALRVPTATSEPGGTAGATGTATPTPTATPAAVRESATSSNIRGPATANTRSTGRLESGRRSPTASP